MPEDSKNSTGIGWFPERTEGNTPLLEKSTVKKSENSVEETDSSSDGMNNQSAEANVVDGLVKAGDEKKSSDNGKSGSSNPSYQTYESRRDTSEPSNQTHHLSLFLVIIIAIACIVVSVQGSWHIWQYTGDVTTFIAEEYGGGLQTVAQVFLFIAIIFPVPAIWLLGYMSIDDLDTEFAIMGVILSIIGLAVGYAEYSWIDEAFGNGTMLCGLSLLVYSTVTAIRAHYLY